MNTKPYFIVTAITATIVLLMGSMDDAVARGHGGGLSGGGFSRSGAAASGSFSSSGTIRLNECRGSLCLAVG
jgi:hypothetical protein